MTEAADDGASWAAEEAVAAGSRFRNLSGPVRWLAKAVLFSITATGLLWATDITNWAKVSILTEQFLALFWTLVLSAVFLTVKAHRGESRTRVPWFDWLAICATLAMGLYLVIDYERLLYESPLLTIDKWLSGLIAIILLIEATRRLVGNALLIILLMFIAYGLFADLVPAPLKGPTVKWERLLVYLYIDTNALIGLPLLVAAKIARWSLISIGPVYFKPQREVFVKPTTAKKIIDHLELDHLTYKPRPSWEFYAGYRQALLEMKSQVNPSLTPNNAAFTGFLMMAL